jgi:hypothetical protein
LYNKGALVTNIFLPGQSRLFWAHFGVIRAIFRSMLLKLTAEQPVSNMA